jgi:Restriction endonuclease EcoRV
VSESTDPREWLSSICSSYKFDPLGVLRADDGVAWPLAVSSINELTDELVARGLLLGLPREPAALANVMEVGIVDFLVEAAGEAGDIEVARGTERGYPDLEVSGTRFGGRRFAVDVKVAQRARTKARLRTQSRITLYTGNTYFRWPNLKWPGTFRPFNDYAGHLDILVIYTLDPHRRERATDVELFVQEPWRIASRKRSSTTREYIGAVDLLADLREGRGEFASAEEFYKYWRAFPFRISAGIQNQLRRLLDVQQAELEELRGVHERDTPGSSSTFGGNGRA